jgi:hypothetical protein
MTAKRQPDGATVYRGQRIQLNTETRPGKLGRYTWQGLAFAQLGHAKTRIDQSLQESQQ